MGIRSSTIIVNSLSHWAWLFQLLLIWYISIRPFVPDRGQCYFWNACRGRQTPTPSPMLKRTPAVKLLTATISTKIKINSIIVYYNITSQILILLYYTILEFIQFKFYYIILCTIINGLNLFHYSIINFTMAKLSAFIIVECFVSKGSWF